ncbi:MAG: outer membrane beta-barrel protein [Akkermansiaceae bacterium]
MKKLAISAFTMASVASSISAQSLFDLAPAAEEEESIPLHYTFSAGVGLDSNPTPLLKTVGGADVNGSSTYATGQVGASFLSVAPQTRTEFFARVGVIHYFDSLIGANDETTPTFGFGLNWNHRISERLRVVSRNFASQELEPNRSLGVGGFNQIGEYLRYSTDNSIGYRWTGRLGTYTGFAFDSLSYDGSARNDVDNLAFYHNFRYQLSPQTVTTLNLRHSDRSVDSGLGDSTNQFITTGLEHRFNPSTIGVIRGGAQLRDVDGGGSSTSPTFEASLSSRVNNQLSFRGYGRYSIEDYSRYFGGIAFDDTATLRLGVDATYSISPKLSLRGGINYSNLDYNDDALASVSEDLLNLYVGFNLEVAENVWVTGTLNWEDAGSDASSREYDRNRVNLGVSTQF